MRIFTCTPIEFGGGSDFFARDSGLLCRGLQSIGVDSRAVMPGSRRQEDEADLIRTAYPNLEQADWWRSQAIDAVVLYAWGRPKFRKVAKAIHDAEIFLILNLDSGGPVSPLAGLRCWLHAQWIFSGGGRGLISLLRFAKLTLRGLSVGLVVTDPLRARHLRCGDVIASVSPQSADAFRRLCRTYGGSKLSDRVTVIPHPVEPHFRHSGIAKHRQVVCVGRWKDQLQKRPRFLTEAIGTVLEQDNEVTVVIAGEPTPNLKAWHDSLNVGARNRVTLAGRMGRKELADLLDSSRVFYSPSAYESFSIAAAEALCSGCSVVAGRSVTMPAFGWFVSEQSGQLASSDRCSEHATALLDELDRWDQGDRDATLMSKIWCDRLHADRIARTVASLLSPP